MNKWKILLNWATTILIIASISIVLFLYSHELATIERGYETLGGELLMPLIPIGIFALIKLAIADKRNRDFYSEMKIVNEFIEKYPVQDSENMDWKLKEVTYNEVTDRLFVDFDEYVEEEE